MFKPTYSKVILRDGKLTVVPADYAERHELVLVRHPMLAQPFLMCAYMTVTERKEWKGAVAAAGAAKVYELSIRAPEVEEAFMACDRSIYPALPVEFFPDAEEYSWTWTATADAEDPAAFAWFVSLVDGGAGRYRQSNDNRVRGVVAGQYSDLGVVES